MNSALKPALGGAGVPAGGQASPAKGNVASNHAAAAVALPQGAQNHSSTLVGQNLSQHAPPHHAPPHAVPSMAPVSANMAQMAQNMSHHGNLSHLNQNSAVPANLTAVPSPSKAATTSSPLSLVQDKVTNASQPLALTRTPEKKDPDSSGHANGTIDSPKSGANAPAALKPQNPEPNKDKQDIAKTSPSTPKPPEKPLTAPSTPQKPEAASPASQASEGPGQPKVATANEPPEKSPSKPTEPTPAPTADVAPSQSNSKPVPESANNQPTPQPPSHSSLPEKAPTPVKQDPPVESAKPESAKTELQKVEDKKDTPEKPSPEKLPSAEDKKEEVKPEPKKEDQVDGIKPEVKPQPPKVEEKVVEEKKEIKKAEAKPKSTLKLATVTPPMRKRRQTSPPKSSEGPPSKKAAEGDSTPSAESRTKRNRTKVQLYQSPTPELAMATKLSATTGRATPTKPNDEKLIVFYKNEYLAVRNAEGGFYVCQAMQNVYRTTRKIKIRWLSQDKVADPHGETYKPDFYDVTDMECVLTTLSLSRGGGGGGGARAGGAVRLAAAERARATSILQRALRAEQGAGAASLDLTPEHPDGLDLSLYTAESQLDNKSRKRRADKGAASPEAAKEPPPAKKARTTPKRSPKSSRKAKTPTKQTNNNKRKSAGSTPVVASTSKVGIVRRIYRNTATAMLEKAKPAAKSTPPKRTPAKRQETPAVGSARGRRAAKESKPSPIVSTPSTSTGKTTRTPRKPPSRK